MSNIRAPRRSSEEWMSLITSCRQSGLSDAAWCEQNGISTSCFYNAVSRLRKKACQIPDPVGKSNALDLTSCHQDVVRIAIESEDDLAERIPDKENHSLYLDNSHTIEIKVSGFCIRLSNSVHPDLLKTLLNTLKESVC